MRFANCVRAMDAPGRFENFVQRVPLLACPAVFSQEFIALTAGQASSGTLYDGKAPAAGDRANSVLNSIRLKIHAFIYRRES